MRLQKTLLVVTAMGIFAIASSCRDIVAPSPVTTVSLSDVSIELVPQETEQLTATPKDASGTALTRPVSWSTSAPEIATVDNGLVTAKKPGSAVVSATTEGVRADVNVSVSDGGIATPSSGNLIIALAGQVMLDVPSAAVSKSGRITIAQAQVAAANARLIPGSAVSVRTQAALTKAAVLIIRYDPTRILGSPESGLRLYQAAPSTWVLVAGSGVDMRAKTVRGNIMNGGVYAIFAQATVSSVTIGPATPGLRVADAAAFTAIARDDESNQVDDRVVAWTSSAPEVVQIDASTGIAQAKSPGSATIKATIEGVSGSTSVSVTPGPAAKILVIAGDGQSADTSSAVAVAPSVKVTDAAGFPVSGETVTFAVVSGGGTISPATTTTDASGIASAAKWILGKTAGLNNVTASIAGGASSTFSSNATQPDSPKPSSPTPAAPKLTPTNIVISSGDGQTAQALTAVAVRPSVKVMTSNGTPVPDIPVTFSIRSGGGSVAGATAMSDSAGIATVGSWVLGNSTLSNGGGNSLFATREGLAGSPVIFVATATAAAPTTPPPPPNPPAGPASGPPVAMLIFAGDGQTAQSRSAVPVAPAVKVVDAANVPVPGVNVTFSIRSGNGTLSGEAATTNSAGIATLGRWTLGDPGGNSLFAASAGLSGNPLIFIATASAGIRIVTFGDSNTDVGWSGTTIMAASYISSATPRLSSSDPNHFTQLAGKIEAKWRAASAVSISAVNHGVSGTRSGTGRTSLNAPNAREIVNGVSRFQAEVLGMGYPWNGGESGDPYPGGPLVRTRAFTPTANDFAYVSIGTNDFADALSADQSAANITWMIDQWVNAGHAADHFILTTLPPRAASNGTIPPLNTRIRSLAATRGVALIDLAGRTSDDNGATWRDAADHIGDQIHYTEPVRDWIAQQVVSYMLTKTPR